MSTFAMDQFEIKFCLLLQCLSTFQLQIYLLFAAESWAPIEVIGVASIANTHAQARLSLKLTKHAAAYNT